MTESWADAVERNVLATLSSKNPMSAVMGMQGLLYGLPTEDNAREQVDAVLARLAQISGWSRGAFGARIRIAIQCAAFRALAGTPGSANRVMPNADACWVVHVAEVIGYRELAIAQPGRFPLDVARHQDVERLFSTWSALDWDGTLAIETTFGRERKRPAIAKRDWTELSRLVGTTTSFGRLCRGERASGTVSQLFAHEDASIDDKIALASQLANRAKGSPALSNDGMEVVVRVLAPYLAQAERPMPSSLQRIAAKVARGNDGDAAHDNG